MEYSHLVMIAMIRGRCVHEECQTTEPNEQGMEQSEGGSKEALNKNK